MGYLLLPVPYIRTDLAKSPIGDTSLEFAGGPVNDPITEPTVEYF